MKELLLTETSLIAVGLLALTFGILVFRGDPKWFKMIAGGRVFLSHNPDPLALSKASKESGVVICLVAALVLSVAAYNAAASLDAPSIILNTTIFIVILIAIILVIAILFAAISQAIAYRQFRK